MENGKKWKAYFNMEDERCQECKGRKELDNGMKDGLPSFHLNFTLQLSTTACKLCKTKLHKSFYVISLLELKQ